MVERSYAFSGTNCLQIQRLICQSVDHNDPFSVKKKRNALFIQFTTADCLERHGRCLLMQLAVSILRSRPCIEGIQSATLTPAECIRQEIGMWRSAPPFSIGRRLSSAAYLLKHGRMRFGAGSRSMCVKRSQPVPEKPPTILITEYIKDKFEIFVLNILPAFRIFPPS